MRPPERLESQLPTDMATPSHEINFLIVTHDFNGFSAAKAPVSLRVPPETNLNDLQRMIKDSCNQALATFSTASLDIWTMTLFPLHLINFLTEALESGSIRSLSRRQMTSEDCISSMGPWPEKSLHLPVQLPAEGLSRTLRLVDSLTEEFFSWKRKLVVFHIAQHSLP